MAHCLDSLPLIDTSFATGEISYSKVRAMTRVATPENEDFLLGIAQHGTASHVEQVVAKYKKVACPNEDKAEVDREQARKLVYYQDDDGMWVIHAKLPAEAGSLVVKAIEAVATSVQQAQQKLGIDKHEVEAEKDVSAETPFARHPDAAIAAVKGPTEQELDAEDPMQQQDTFVHRRADALITMAEHFLASSNPDTRYQGMNTVI